MNRFAWGIVALAVALCPCVGALTGSGDSQVGLLDTMGPTVTNLQVSQPNADPGEAVTITFDVSEPLLGNPLVYVNGYGALFVGESGGTYTYTFTVRPGGGGPTPADIHISASDALGNVGTLDDSALLTLNFPAVPVRVWAVVVALVVLGAVVARRLGRAAHVTLILAVFAAPAAHGQAPEVTNVHFTQQPRSGGGTEVVITYDLTSLLCNCDIAVSLSKNAGADGFSYPVTSITGDIAHVAPGVDRRIVWDIAADYPNEHMPQAQLRVTAMTRPDDLTPWQRGNKAHVFAYASSCRGNLVRTGLVLKEFTFGGNVWFPKLSSVPGRLMFTQDEIYAGCRFDPEWLSCQGRIDPPPLVPYDDKHYVYLGYAVRNEIDVMAFVNAYSAQTASGGEFSGDLPGVTSFGNAVYRLRENLVPAENKHLIPIMFEWPDNHQEGFGGNVLYMDGHVSFIRYPGEFPMTEATISALGALAGYEPPTGWNYPLLTWPYSLERETYHFGTRCSANITFELQHFILNFARDNPQERLPRLSSEPGRLMMREDEVYPLYIPKPDVLICPGAAPITPKPRFDDQHFAFLGYAVRNDEDVAAFVDAYWEEIGSGGDFSDDLPAEASYGDELLRLRLDIGRFLTTNVNDPSQCIPDREFPILIEWPGNHKGISGGHIVYLDGHVEWRDYPGEFPMTANTIAALASLAGHLPTTAYAQLQPWETLDYDPYGWLDACSRNLGTVDLACLGFGRDQSSRQYARISNTPGKLMVAQSEVFPEYVDNPNFFVCPAAAPTTLPPDFDDRHYVYFGYVMTNDSDVRAFAQAYQAEVTGGGDFSDDLPISSSYGNSLVRLRVPRSGQLFHEIDPSPEGFVGDHEIPVLMEWPGNHQALTGGHVQFLDGHREFVPYPGKFPMTESTVTTLASIANWAPTTSWASKDFTREHDPHLQALCQDNLFSLGISMRTFGWPEFGFLPQLSNAPGRLMFTSYPMVPFYLDDIIRLSCPASSMACATPVVDDHSYVYLGYAVMTDDDVEAFANAYLARLAEGGDFSADLPGNTSLGSTIHRLRNDLAFLATERSRLPSLAASRIPMLIEWPDNHDDLSGGNVLFMDYHVEWIPYPGGFPMTEATMNILTTLAGRPPIE
ncbi:MAG: hypothetical protein HUU46_06230 [Candidatus Hydrogenedentes bacterium]|nr:hypothetical protein [Candidatus Hydrogenedentota bacterium]